MKHKQPSDTFKKRLTELKKAQTRIEAKMAILEKTINLIYFEFKASGKTPDEWLK